MLDLVNEHCEEIRLKKGKYLIRQGVSDGNLYVVAKGLLKVYYITNSGKEFIKSFIETGGYIASVSAMLGVSTCPFSVVALEDSQLFRIPSESILGLSDDPKKLSLINASLLQLIQKKEKREYEFLCLSAEERYLEFRDEYPTLEQRVSQSEVARYLGITPVALSRIRKRLS